LQAFCFRHARQVDDHGYLRSRCAAPDPVVIRFRQSPTTQERSARMPSSLVMADNLLIQ
jgi:hypothetical protein